MIVRPPGVIGLTGQPSAEVLRSPVPDRVPALTDRVCGPGRWSIAVTDRSMAGGRLQRPTGASTAR